MNSALLVIDAQQSFAVRDSWIVNEAAPYLKNQQKLIDACQKRGLPVIQILHVEPEGVFSMDSGHVQTIKELSLQPDNVFYKTRHSALIGTGLDVWLRERNIGHLIISGIRTEQCCETTTRHASDLGFKVSYVTEATHTFAMQHTSSQEHFDVAAIKRRTELVLENRFADIHTVESILTQLKSVSIQ